MKLLEATDQFALTLTVNEHLKNFPEWTVLQVWAFCGQRELTPYERGFKEVQAVPEWKYFALVGERLMGGGA